MTNEIDFLNQDPNPAEQVETPQDSAAENTFVAPSWDDVKSGKINYQDLPPQMKSKVKREAYEATPDDKKYLFDDYNFTPPETYHGFDKHGNKVQAYDLDGFEELVKKGKISKKTKVEQDVENLTNLVKEQNKNIISQQERDLDKRLSEAKENTDFETYEKLLGEKQDLKFQKLQLEKAPKEEPKQAAPDYSETYSIEEQAAIQVFAENNKVFTEIMRRSPEMTKYFDEQAEALLKRNPNAPIDKIMAATKTITENRFNLNKQQRPMTRNFMHTEQKTTLASGSEQSSNKVTYNMISRDPRALKWFNSEKKSGKDKFLRMSDDQIADDIFGKSYRLALAQKNKS